MITLTKRQTECLAFIRQFQGKHGHGPSYDDIAAGIGLASKGNVCRYIQLLDRAGIITKPKGTARNYVLHDTTERNEAEGLLRAIVFRARLYQAVRLDDACMRDAINHLGFSLDHQASQAGPAPDATAAPMAAPGENARGIA